MSILSVSGLGKYYGAEFIFGGISFQVSRGDKTALVGRTFTSLRLLKRVISTSASPTPWWFVSGFAPIN